MPPTAEVLPATHMTSLFVQELTLSLWVITLGMQKEVVDIMRNEGNVIRPANYNKKCPVREVSFLPQKTVLKSEL